MSYGFDSCYRLHGFPARGSKRNAERSAWNTGSFRRLVRCKGMHRHEVCAQHRAHGSVPQVEEGTGSNPVNAWVRHPSELPPKYKPGVSVFS